MQYTILADLYLHVPSITDYIRQIAVTMAFTTDTLVDLLGRESEHAWNMWGTHSLIVKGNFAAFASSRQNGPGKLQVGPSVVIDTI